MTKRLSFLFALLVIASPAIAGQGWTGIKEGMTKQEALKKIGRPLFANVARGYEVWFYDNQGDVTLCGGRVLYWKTPQTPEAAKPVVAAPAPRSAVKAPAVEKYLTDRMDEHGSIPA